MRKHLFAFVALMSLGCGKPDDGSRPGMPPDQETPDQYVERIRKSDLPEADKQATLQRFEASRKAMAQMQAQAQRTASNQTNSR